MIEASFVDLVFEAAWKSVLVSGAVLLLLALLKRRSAAERACVAHFGMAAVLLLPVMILAGPRLELLPGAEQAPASVAAPADSAAPAQLLDPAVPMAADAAGEAPPIAASGPWLSGDAAFILYAVPAAILLLMTLVAILRLFALRRRASVIVQQGWLTALAHAQRRMGIKSGTALLVSGELTSPVSWGVLRPIILLSEDMVEKPLDAEAIIAHELAHVARFDWLNLLVARIATATFWFNPLVWLLARQGHQLREEAADDAVLCANVPNTDYAALLVGTARHEGKGLLLAANGVAPGKGSLSLRVRRILEPRMRRTPACLSWGAACAAGALLVAGPVAALTQHVPAVPPLPPVAEAPPVPAAAVAMAFAPPAPAAAEVPVAAATPATVPVPPPGVAAAPGAAVAPVAAARAAAGIAPVAATPPTPATPKTPHVPISPSSLVAMRAHGVTPAVHEEYAAAYPRLRHVTADQLVSLRIHNVTPARLREYTQLGYGYLDCDRIIEWAVHGVTPNYIRSLAAEGYARLTPDQLTDFRVMGVTPAFIREVRESGFGRVSPAQLVDLRVMGTGQPPGPPRATPVPVPRPRPGRSG